MLNCNHNGNKKSPMKWMMIICVLFLIVLFFTTGKSSSSGSLQPILIGVFVVAHIWMMIKGCCGRNKNTADEKIESKTDTDKPKSGDCCH